MDYKFYICNKSESGGYKEFGIVQRNYFSENIDSLIRFQIKNRSVFVYRKTNYGISSFLDGEKARHFIYLGDSASKILKQIELLDKIYDYSDLRKYLSVYPHIAHITLTTLDIDGNTYYKRFEQTFDYYKKYINLNYNTIFSEDKEHCFLFSDYSNSFGEPINSTNAITAMVKYADNLMTELKHFKLDLSKLKYSKSYLSYKNSSFDPKLKRAIAIGGLFIAKAIVKSIGADLNTSFNFDIPDVDVDFSEIESLDFNSDYTPIEYAHIEEQHNISFNASPNTDGYRPNGSITLERTISGSTDSFPHYTKDGHDFVKIGSHYIQVDKGKTITINNIKYDTV